MNYVIVIVFLSSFVGFYFTFQSVISVIDAIKNGVGYSMTHSIAFASMGWASLIAILTN